MRWSYDTEARALYVYLRDEAADRQEELPDGGVVDVASSGAVVGIELIGPWPWSAVTGVLDRVTDLDADTRAFFVALAMQPMFNAPLRERNVPKPLAKPDEKQLSTTTSALPFAVATAA